MYKSLVTIQITLHLVKIALILWILIAFIACFSTRNTQLFTYLSFPLEKTWQGVEVSENDSVFYKLTFLPHDRYRLITLTLPEWKCQEFSGSYHQQNDRVFLPSFEKVNIYGNLMQVNDKLPALRWLDDEGKQTPFFLTPFEHPLTEKIWEGSAFITAGKDTLFFPSHNPLLIRFRADNFDILTLFPQKALWGFYILRHEILCIHATTMDPIESMYLPSGQYRMLLNESSLILTDSDGNQRIFTRKIFQ